MLQLRFFSWQTQHCESTFSAKGLTVDATLLTAVSNELFVLVREADVRVFEIIFR